MQSEDPEICHTCDNSRAWHEQFKPIHPFNNGDSGAKAFLNTGRARDPRSDRNGAQRASETPPTVVWPSDPVLRIALINKGVLTADDLRTAEEGLRAAMGDALRGAPQWSATGEGSTDSSIATDSPSTSP